MEEVNDTNDRRRAPNTYGSSQADTASRMQPAETSSSHNAQNFSTYPPPPNFQIPPSPYGPGPQPPPSHAPPYHGTYPQPYPPQARDQPMYGPDAGYSRPGSVSGPSRSPADAQHPQYHATNGTVHEHPYSSHPPSGEYSHPPPTAHGIPDSPANGRYPPAGLPIATGHDMMSAQPATPQAPHYGPPLGSATPATPIYQTPYFGQPNDNFAGRKRPVRAAHACEPCRQRKAKCDEATPCGHCKDNALNCLYREVSMPKQEKQAMEISGKLEAMDGNIHMILDMQRSQAEQIKLLQDHLLKGGSSSSKGRATDSSTDSLEDRSGAPTSQMSKTPHSEKVTSRSKTDVADGLTLPAQHITAAENLLAWPSVKSLIPEKQKQTYVMDIEATRGLLRLYGCGEGEVRREARIPNSPADSSASTNRADDEVSIPSPGGVWGTGQLPARSPDPEDSSIDHPGGVGPNGGLILDAVVVERLHASYIKHMHSLNPFLDIQALRTMVENFKREYSKDYAPLPYHKIIESKKRKREQEDSPPLSSFPSGEGAPHAASSVVEVEHSMTNAIILLIMALGKICLHKKPLPGPPSSNAAPTSTPQAAASPATSLVASAHNIYGDLPYSQSPGSKPGVLSATSPQADPRGKNMDVIPGLAYFARGADIIGEQPGGSDLKHIHANLLAALYMGQLARIFPSYYYIKNACTACQIKIESKDFSLMDDMSKKKNSIKFAFWTCLQLESDILAEVRLPPSGISRYEAKMATQIPTGITLEHDDNTWDDDVLRHYTIQIQLRRTLNEVHSSLYTEQGDKTPEQIFRNVRTIDQNLNEFRAWLKNSPEPWDWNDQEHKSAKINFARMRGKYYGAKYIIHRPVLYHALEACRRWRLERAPETPSGNDRMHSPAVPRFHSREQGSMAPPHRMVERLNAENKWILQAAETCIQAAIRSTTAFDAVPQIHNGASDRLIITNIFGTAHAQFGNMLVLAGTFNSDLSFLVDETILRTLLERTINFLKLYAPISPTLAKDAEILEHVRGQLFRGMATPTTSFSA